MKVKSASVVNSCRDVAIRNRNERVFRAVSPIVSNINSEGIDQGRLQSKEANVVEMSFRAKSEAGIKIDRSIQKSSFYNTHISLPAAY